MGSFRASSSPPSPSPRPLPSIPTLYLNDIKFLASPELRGRNTGSPELEKAAAFLEQHYRQLGIKPGRQELPAALPGHHRCRPRQGQPLPVHRKRPAPPRCIAPKSSSPSISRETGPLAGAVVFAGYGITAPEYSYDDYAGLDVKGKIVLVLRHEPQESDAKSVFEGKTFTQHAQFAAKATNAKLHGAIGVILVTDRANHPGAADELEKFGVTVGPTNARIGIRPGQGSARRKVVRRRRQEPGKDSGRHR